MIEHILLDENEQKQAQTRSRGASKTNWLAFVLGSLVLVAGSCALVYFVSKSPSVGTTPTAPVLSAAQVCDACTIYPDMNTHLTCHSCRFHAKESKTFKCPAGYGEMRFTSVSKGRKPAADALAFVQKSCDEQYSSFNSLAEEPFSCEVQLSDLWHAKEPVVEDMPEDNIDVAEDPEFVEENGELVLSKKWRNMLKAEWTCGKLDDEPEIEYVEAEDAPVFLSSAQFVAEPFLANTLVKCDKRKTISRFTEVGKVCQANNAFSFTCDPAGEDVRIILLKFKQKGQGQGKQISKKQGKARSALGTDFCATNMDENNACSFDLSSVLLDGETEADLENAVFDVKYMCSYGKALSEPAEPALLSSALEQPSNLFLQNALVKCGKRKQRGNFMEVGKVCTDENFTLECNAAGTDARIIVLGFWSGKKSKEGKRVSRKRAGLATEVCQDPGKFTNNVCTFTLEDVYLDGESADTFVDTTFNVKYMCSFGAPLPAQ